MRKIERGFLKHGWHPITQFRTSKVALVVQMLGMKINIQKLAWMISYEIPCLQGEFVKFIPTRGFRG